MGVGDRHSKRAVIQGAARITKITNPVVEAAARTATPRPMPRAPSPSPSGLMPFPVDARDLDDTFSAWDIDDALARKPGQRAKLAEATASTVAKTRIARKPLLPSDAAEGTPMHERPAIIAALASIPSPAPEPEPEPDPSIKLVDPVSMNDIVLSRARTIDDPLTTRLLAEISRTDLMNEREVHLRPTRDLTPSAPAVAGRESAELGAARSPILEDELRARVRTTRRQVVRPKDEPFRKK